MPAPEPELYATLGLSPTATQAQISRAYRVLLRRHHPDTRDPGDEHGRVASDTALQQVLAAYAVLHDPVRRAAYDQQSRASRPVPRQRRGNDRVVGRPPIIAGPVRWHAAP
ncbi:J domain-containing protein [Intrasporangium flavum]|uniref:J domain-containing protein n=1 Tax=Intrasporangium flavum TaxID=1428657 RepID=UPI00096C1A82|nr:J domain-containing protein [Intrasporangium flavum]